MSIRTPAAVAILVAAAASLSVVPAAAWDSKTYGLTSCQPYLPDTTAGEVVISPTGIYNPGTTNEKVLCTLPRDQEAMYVVGDMVVSIYYRVLGAAQQRMTCTLFVGTSTMQSTAVTTVSGTGPYASAGARESVSLGDVAQDITNIQVPNTVMCSIPPKTSMGGIWMREEKATESIPEPV